MRFVFVLAALVASAGSAALAFSGTADALTMASLHCPADIPATLQIVNEGGSFEIRGQATPSGRWSGGGVGARILDRRALDPGTNEIQVVLAPLVAWVHGKDLICSYRLTTTAYRVDAQITTPCPATSGRCSVPGDGRAPNDFRFDHAP